jgi:hypothetical protein
VPAVAESSGDGVHAAIIAIAIANSTKADLTVRVSNTLLFMINGSFSKTQHVWDKPVQMQALAGASYMLQTMLLVNE